MLMLTESTLHFMTLTWALSSKKFGLAGKTNNWRNHLEPETKSKVSPVMRPETERSGGSVLSVTTLKTSQTVATMVSLAKDPPLSLTDSSDSSISDNGDDGGDEEDRDGNNEYFKEYLSTDVQGKVGMKVSHSFSFDAYSHQFVLVCHTDH
jgi:hypothetical protein